MRSVAAEQAKHAEKIVKTIDDKFKKQAAEMKEIKDSISALQQNIEAMATMTKTAGATKPSTAAAVAASVQ